MSENRPVLVILDDDPTGTQTTHDLAVYLRWDVETLAEAMKDPRPGFFLQTNSRALPPLETARLHARIAEQVVAAAHKSGKGFLLVSRSDSTLRGHFPLETDVLHKVLHDAGRQTDMVLLCPCFFEGGRVTMDGVHYVREGEHMMPVGQTEFARDISFGYTQSDLVAWIVEKTGGRARRDDCGVLTLRDIRAGQAASIIQETEARYLAVDGELPSDMAAVSAAVFTAIAGGRHMVIRCAASLVQALCGQQTRPLLKPSEMVGNNNRGGLVVVGSHVDKTNRQLAALRQLDVDWVHFDVSTPQAYCVPEARLKIDKALAKGRTAVLFTTRQVRPMSTQQENLTCAAEISQGLASVVRGLTQTPRFLIAKGGITSYDVVVAGLGAKTATVMGCAAPGVPVWQLGDGSKFPSLPYIIFPGNVGGDHLLHNLVDALTEER